MRLLYGLISLFVINGDLIATSVQVDPKVIMPDELKILRITTKEHYFESYMGGQSGPRAIAQGMAQHMDRHGIHVDAMVRSAVRQQIQKRPELRLASANADFTAQSEVRWYAIESPPDSGQTVAVAAFGILGAAMTQNEPTKVRPTMSILISFYQGTSRKYRVSGKADIHHPKVPPRTINNYLNQPAVLRSDWKKAVDHAVASAFDRLPMVKTRQTQAASSSKSANTSSKLRSKIGTK